MAQERTAKNLGVELTHIELVRGQKRGKWTHPTTGEDVSVEFACLGYYERLGWRGTCREGGLILNLIKAMSFPKLDTRNKSTCIEALYAQNVAFDEDRFDVPWLLGNVKSANDRRIRDNFRTMSSGTGELEWFPTLEEWMFIDLYVALGNSKIHDIAEVFSKEPYQYRSGWPDLTIWKDGEVKFIEVKAHGDNIHKNQRIIIKDVIKPLELNFEILDVQAIPGGVTTAKTSKPKTNSMKKTAFNKVSRHLFAQGRQIIEYHGKICLLTCDESYSFSIRHFKNDDFTLILSGDSDIKKYQNLEGNIRIMGDCPFSIGT